MAEHKHEYILDSEETSQWWVVFWCVRCRTWLTAHRPLYQALMRGRVVVVETPSPYWHSMLKVDSFYRKG